MVKSFIVFILFSFLFTFHQTDFILEKELNFSADQFSTDQLANIYLVSRSQIKRVESSTLKEKSYSNSLLGNIHSIDVSDPFRLLLFYKDFNKIEFIDKNLAPIAGTINLDDLNFYNVAAACQSVNGGFWIFDQSLTQLVYLDKTLNNTKKSSKFSEMIDQNYDYEQVFMLEKNDYIYLGIEGTGILLFDSYGTYIKTFPITDIKSFQITGDNIIYYTEGKMNFYNMRSFEIYSLTLPEQNIISARMENKKIFIQTIEKILIYQLNNF